MGGTRDPATGTWTGTDKPGDGHGGRSGQRGTNCPAAGGRLASAKTESAALSGTPTASDKYEVTAGQYTEFLNAVAKTDIYWLLQHCMCEQHGYRLQDSVERLVGQLHLQRVIDYANRPVNCVSLLGRLPICQLAAKRPADGPQGPGTTETGAYTLTHRRNQQQHDCIAKRRLRNGWCQAKMSGTSRHTTRAASPTPATGTYPTSSDTAPGSRHGRCLRQQRQLLLQASDPYPIDSGSTTTTVVAVAAAGR